MLGSLQLYAAITRVAFRRQLAYRTANLAGLATNAFFGLLRASLFIALFQSSTQPTIGGYDLQAAASYTWVTQAMIMVVSLWGWWDIETTIRSGDVVTDLARPFSFLGYWLARDYGRAAYFALFRGLPGLIFGQLTFAGGLRWPSTPVDLAMLLVSLLLAVTISFAWRFLLNVSAFWTTDARGLGGIAGAMVMFLGGFIVPLRFFPDWIQPVLLSLPFAAIIQVPSDIFIGRLSGVAALAALGSQAIWAIAMLAFAQVTVLVAVRRVSVQGG
ncbi:MAG TPA: ABC-2 family transporter protein [Chloroflexota bacterium]|jgi:ABC-2 type transport system permease protein